MVPVELDGMESVPHAVEVNRFQLYYDNVYTRRRLLEAKCRGGVKVGVNQILT